REPPEGRGRQQQVFRAAADQRLEVRNRPGAVERMEARVRAVRVLREVESGLATQRDEALVSLADHEDARAAWARGRGELPQPIGHGLLLLVVAGPPLARLQRLL